MTTRNLLNAIQSIAALIALVAAGSASAQQFAPGERIMLINTAGAVGRMMETSLPGTAVFMFPPNVSQSRLLWTFTPETLTFTQGGFTQSKVGFKIASVTDGNEVLSPSASNFYDGALVSEMRDLNPRFPSRWEVIRVPGLPFFQLRNVWNSSVCLTQNNPLVRLGYCNWNDSRQWFSLMNSNGMLK